MSFCGVAFGNGCLGRSDDCVTVSLHLVVVAHCRWEREYRILGWRWSPITSMFVTASYDMTKRAAQSGAGLALRNGELVDVAAGQRTRTATAPPIEYR